MIAGAGAAVPDPSEAVLLVLLTNNFLVGRRRPLQLGTSEVDRTRVTLEVLLPGSPAVVVVVVVERVARKRPLVVDDSTFTTPVSVSERELIDEEV